MNKVDFSQYDNSWYHPGSLWKRTAWYFANALVMLNPLVPFCGLKVRLLRAFGAHIGRGVCIKPCVNVKYPWLLSVGDYTWIGENVWIDCLAPVTIGNNVCISQGALLLCGNHDYKSRTFDLKLGAITLEDGAWVGAKAVVCPGVTMGSHSVLAVGSVASKDLLPYTIYRGNPAVKTGERTIR